MEEDFKTEIRDLKEIIDIFLDQMTTIAANSFDPNGVEFKNDFCDKVIKFIDARLRILDIEVKLNVGGEVDHSTIKAEDREILASYIGKQNKIEKK